MVRCEFCVEISWATAGVVEFCVLRMVDILDWRASQSLSSSLEVVMLLVEAVLVVGRREFVMVGR